MERPRRRIATGRLLIVLLLCCILPLPAARAQGTQETSSPPGSVWVIPIEGTIDLGLAEFVKRAIAQAEDAGAALLLFEVNTFGGRVDAATEIRDAMFETAIPKAVFVSERAISAGALIALAGDTLIMAPGATIGAAEPRPLDEKTLSYVRSEFEATAERTGRDPLIAAAMVDARLRIDGVVDEGEILTLTAGKANELGFIDFIARSRSEVFTELGLDWHSVVETRLTWAESVVRFLTDPIVSQILLTIGFLGLLFEVTSPGWGVPGSVGLVSLAAFFGSRLLVGLLGLEAILLFILGIVLLLLEVFVIPGFGIAGLLGIVAIGVSLFLSFPDPATALQAIAITLLAMAVVILVFLRRFQGSALWGRLILTQRQEGADYVPAAEMRDIFGREGVALTPLRPAGKIEINGEHYDAVSDGPMITRGERVRVVKVEGNRIVVRQVVDA